MRTHALTMYARRWDASPLRHALDLPRGGTLEVRVAEAGDGWPPDTWPPQLRGYDMADRLYGYGVVVLGDDGRVVGARFLASTLADTHRALVAARRAA